MRMQKVGYKKYAVMFQGMTRFFETETDAKSYMQKIEDMMLNLV